MYITFSKTFDNKGNILTGLYFVLSVGSFFLWTSTMLDNFKESGNLLSFYNVFYKFFGNWLHREFAGNFIVTFDIRNTGMKTKAVCNSINTVKDLNQF